ncbi:beta strand repeat-containing protein [Treponema primitia]|uniref:beta strand repeat-containing protein n=1 Tax=Treponema primitia TaxID=88058 RepID=UPI00025558B6|nr:hypothetical protein [Treponema primitia]
MTNYTGPKKISAVLFLGCLIFSACSNIFESSNRSADSIPPGKGRVIVKIGNSSNASIRTLMPLDIPVFSKYELDFTAAGQVPFSETVSSSAGIARLTGSGFPVDLAPAVWSLTLTAFVSNGGAYLRAAQNTITLDVIDGALTLQTITVDPIPITQGGDGLFHWNLAVSGVSYTGTLTVAKEGGSAVLSKNFPADNLTGTAAVPAGYYVMILELTNDANKTARRVEVVHIYPGLTTNGDFNFSAGDFVTQKYLEGTLSLSDFSSGAVSALTVRAYSSGFTELLDTTTTAAAGTWKMKVPVTHNDVDFLAIITTTDSKTYTLIAGAASVGDAGQSGITLSAVHKPVVTWAELKQALDRIPPASTGFAPDGESVLSIGASFTAAADPGTIVLTKPITLKADTAPQTITRGTGMSGAFFDIQSGGSLTLGETSAASLLTLNGDFVTAVDALVTVNGGSLVMNDNALIANNTNYGVSVNTGGFTMSGSAQVAQNNPVYLAAGRAIILGGDLTQSPAAAIALPASTALDAQVLEGSAYLSGNHRKFTIAGYDPDVRWVNAQGKLEFVKFLEGTLSLSAFSGGTALAITVKAYSAGFTAPLDADTAVNTGGTWTWKAKVPLAQNAIDFLAIITTADGKTYTVIAGTVSSAGDQSGISLSVTYNPIVSWAGLKEAIDRIPPASTADFTPADESVLVIGASFTATAAPGTIVLNKAITLKADTTSDRNITRETGMTGAFFDIQSGGSLTLGETSAVKLLTLDGGSVTAAAALVAVNGGSLVMNNNALIANNTNYGVSVNTGGFTMSGSAQVAQNNPVYLAAGRTITLGGALTQTLTAAIALPASTALDAQVLDGAISGNNDKFTIAGYDPDVRWVNAAGQLEQLSLVLEGTLSLTDFSGGAPSVITVSAYSDATFTSTSALDSVSAVNAGTWTWKVKVPVTCTNAYFLAAITAGGKTYTLIVGTTSVEGTSKSGIDLSAVYKPVTSWAELKQALGRIPAFTSFVPGEESVLVIGASFDATDSIVLNKAITLKADSSDQSITRGTGMTGAFFDIQSGGSLTLSETSAAKLLTLNGGSVTAAAAIIAVNGGSLIMKDKASITNNTSYGVSVNTGSFTMSGSAQVAQNNPVYLETGRTIALGGALTQTTAAAITWVPATYTANTPVLDGTISGNNTKFTIAGYDPAVRYVDTNGKPAQREPSITCVIGYSQLSFSGAAVAVDRDAMVTVTALNATGLMLSGWTASGRDYRGARITLSNVTGATGSLTFTAPSAAGEYDITITVSVNGKIHSGNFRLRVRA